MAKKNSETPEDEITALQPESEAVEVVDEEDPVGEETESPVEDPAAVISRLEQEKNELHDRFLRLRADLENIRRRAREELAESRQKTTEEILLKFLPVFDNLERAVNAQSETESWRRGVEMVLRQFQETLAALGLQPIRALGEIFDPRFHEAVLQEPADAPDNTILMELQRGYTLGEKVIRPSLVKVAKALK